MEIFIQTVIADGVIHQLDVSWIIMKFQPVVFPRPPPSQPERLPHNRMHNSVTTEAHQAQTLGSAPHRCQAVCWAQRVRREDHARPGRVR